MAVLGLCDDDVVERSNLHRQILFDDGDVGTPKVDAAARALGAVRRRGSGSTASSGCTATRLLPDNALSIVREYDVVLEGADNFATKFLAADACALARVPGRPRLRRSLDRDGARRRGAAARPATAASSRTCFPRDDAPNCAEAGVMGPVVGVVAAAQVDLALSLLDGSPAEGQLVTFDGRTDVLRRRTISRRADCPLCGSGDRARRASNASNRNAMFRPRARAERRIV